MTTRLAKDNNFNAGMLLETLSHQILGHKIVRILWRNPAYATRRCCIDSTPLNLDARQFRSLPNPSPVLLTYAAGYQARMISGRHAHFVIYYSDGKQEHVYDRLKVKQDLRCVVPSPPLSKNPSPDYQIRAGTVKRNN